MGRGVDGCGGKWGVESSAARECRAFRPGCRVVTVGGGTEGERGGDSLPLGEAVTVLPGWKVVTVVLG